MQALLDGYRVWEPTFEWGDFDVESESSVLFDALAVALASALGVGAMVASFRGSVEDWLGTTLSADVFASPPALVSARDWA